MAYDGQLGSRIETLPGEEGTLLFTEHDRRAAYAAARAVEDGGPYPVAIVRRLHQLATAGDSFQARYLLGKVIGSIPDEPDNVVDFMAARLPQDRSGLCTGYDEAVGRLMLAKQVIGK